MIRILVALLISGLGSFFWAKPCRADSSHKRTLEQELAESSSPPPREASDLFDRMEIGVHFLLLGRDSFGSFSKQGRLSNNRQDSSGLSLPSVQEAPSSPATTQRQEDVAQAHAWLRAGRSGPAPPSLAEARTAGPTPVEEAPPRSTTAQRQAPAQENPHQRSATSRRQAPAQRPKAPKRIRANPNAQGLSQDGFYVQEAELHFKALVDDYWSGNLSLGIEWHSANSGRGHFDWNLEEAFVESRFLSSWIFKLGKFYAHIGSHNRLHAHDWPFPDAPLIYQTLFVGHGRLSGTGLSVSFAPSLPWDFSLTAQAFYSSKGGKGFSDMKNLSGLLLMKSAWDFNKKLSAEWSAAFGSGLHSVRNHGGMASFPNFLSRDSQFSRIFKRLYSSSFALKYYLRGRLAGKPFLSWTTEFLQGQGQDGKKLSAGGLSSWLKLRLLENWLLKARAEYTGETPAQINHHRYSLLGAFKPTDRSALRLQYSYINKSHYNASAFKPHSLSFQAVMSWGTSH